MPRGFLVPVEPISALLGLVVLQTGYYVVLGISLTLMSAVSMNHGPELNDLFITSDMPSAELLAIGLAHCAAYGPLILLLAFVAQHSSHVADHVVTLLVVHLALQLAFNGFPRSGAWWLMAATDCVVLIFIGEVAVLSRDASRFGAMSAELENASWGNPTAHRTDGESLVATTGGTASSLPAPGKT